MSSTLAIARTNSTIVHYNPNDLLPPWQMLAKVILEMAIQIIVPIGLIMVAYAALHVSISAVVLPVLAVGTIFATAFIFASRQPVPVPVNVANLFPNPSVGIPNGGNDCFISSLAQAMRCDRGLMDWFDGVPTDLLEEMAPALILPLNVLFPAGDPIDLEYISANEPLPMREIPANLAELTPAQRAEFRAEGDEGFMSWVRFNPEIECLTLDPTFAATNIPAARFDRYPVAEREDRQADALSCLQEIRQFCTREQMTEPEKRALIKKIQQWSACLSLLRMHGQALINVPLGAIFNLEEPVGGQPQPFAATPQQRAAIEAIRHRAVLEEMPREVRFQLLQNISTLQKIRQMAQPERLNLLKYLRVLQKNPSFERFSQASYLLHMNAFYAQYNAADQNFEHWIDPALGASHRLRSAAALISPTISLFGQHDPMDVFMAMKDLFPPELMAQEESRRILDISTFGAPPRRPEGMIRQRHSGPACISLEIVGANPTLEELLAAYRDKDASNDGTVRYPDGNGVEQNYSFTREQYQFVQAPPTLWINLKRGQVRGSAAPVQVPPQIALDPIDGPNANYRLDGFIVHSGTAAGGHYVSYKRETNPEGESVWYCNDDSHVYRIAGDALDRARSNATTLVYSKL